MIIVTSGEYSDYGWQIATTAPKADVLAVIAKYKRAEAIWIAAREMAVDAADAAGGHWGDSQWMAALDAALGDARAPDMDDFLRELPATEIEEINADNVDENGIET